jgi:signal peptidase II
MGSREGHFLLAGGVAAADRLTKWLVETRVAPWESIAVAPGWLNIVHSKNRGAAFGLFSEHSEAWRTAVLVGVSGAVMLAVAVMLWQATAAASKESRWMRAALALVLGGAAGNLYDRLRFGMVTDFLDLHWRSYHWHTFNLADSAISAGAALIALDLWLSRRREAKT